MSAQDLIPDIISDRRIAIVGMAGRFPGAADLDGFWRLLMARGDAIRPAPAERWDATAPLACADAAPAVGGFLDCCASPRPRRCGPMRCGATPRGSTSPCSTPTARR
jgi:hypothetical protein